MQHSLFIKLASAVLVVSFTTSIAYVPDDVLAQADVLAAQGGYEFQGKRLIARSLKKALRRAKRQLKQNLGLQKTTGQQAPAPAPAQPEPQRAVSPTPAGYAPEQSPVADYVPEQIPAAPPTAPLANKKRERTETQKRKQAERKARQEAKKLAKSTKVAKQLANVQIESIRPQMVSWYPNTSLQETVAEGTRVVNLFIRDSKSVSNTQVEGVVRDAFATAVADTGVFAQELLNKHSLQNIAIETLMNKNAMRDLEKTVKKEVEEYAKAELNKVGNQVIAAFVPQLEGLNLDLNNLNEDTLKASVRQWAVNSLAQAYLGPQFLVFAATFELLFPKEAAKVHAELRRFDKKYIQSGSDKVEAEWKRHIARVRAEMDRAKDRVKAELKRAEKNVKKEYSRNEKRAKKEIRRVKKKLRL